MLMPAKFDRGDVVTVELERGLGREQRGIGKALVLSPAAFNVLGVVMVAPIVEGGGIARYAGFAVALSGSGTQTRGVALVSQIRMLDLEERAAKKVESVPDIVIVEALARLQAIFE